tara:strand:+ start:99 stop:404 length:306 start_codon:yes stop_codon:yes gene_type:complete
MSRAERSAGKKDGDQMNLDKEILQKLILEVLAEEKPVQPDVTRTLKKMQASGIETYLKTINTRVEFEQFMKMVIKAVPTKDTDKRVVLRQIIGAKPEEEQS